MQRETTSRSMWHVGYRTRRIPTGLGSALGGHLTPARLSEPPKQGARIGRPVVTSVPLAVRVFGDDRLRPHRLRCWVSSYGSPTTRPVVLIAPTCRIRAYGG